MNLPQRIELLEKLGHYMTSDDEAWQSAKHKASVNNPWFTPEFINLATENIAQEFLTAKALQRLISGYFIPQNQAPQNVGIVMAGNIPLVGFHDWLCVFLTGHIAYIKLSSKDDVLLPFLLKKMNEWESSAAIFSVVSERLNGCDAYIATGSNNSAVHFSYYFRHHPHLIRKNRTSVAILWGDETPAVLEKLADDVHLYFGLGCRNVTKIYVPNNYDFVPLLNVFEKYHHLINFNKYKNNFEYNLALHILNKREYMTNDSLLLVEDKSFFSPISQLHYEYYSDAEKLKQELKLSQEIQTIVSSDETPFGQSQRPDICAYADGVDTMDFLLSLPQRSKIKEVRKS